MINNVEVFVKPYLLTDSIVRIPIAMSVINPVWVNIGHVANIKNDIYFTLMGENK
jgi:hypothetical protein